MPGNVFWQVSLTARIILPWVAANDSSSSKYVLPARTEKHRLFSNFNQYYDQQWIKLKHIFLAFQMMNWCSSPTLARHKGVAVGSWEDRPHRPSPELLGSLHHALEHGGRCPSWLAEDQVVQVKVFLAPYGESCSATDFPLGLMQGGGRNLLQDLCSLRWGRSAADEALHSPGHPLFLQLCWGTDAASAPAAAASPDHASAGPLDFILNIYRTFVLMPITWEVFQMMGIKAKTRIFARGWTTKKQSLTVCCWEHTSPAVLQVFLLEWHFCSAFL